MAVSPRMVGPRGRVCILSVPGPRAQEALCRPWLSGRLREGGREVVCLLGACGPHMTVRVPGGSETPIHDDAACGPPGLDSGLSRPC